MADVDGDGMVDKKELEEVLGQHGHVDMGDGTTFQHLIDKFDTNNDRVSSFCTLMISNWTPMN